MVRTRPNSGTCWIGVLSILFLQLAWNLNAFTPELTTNHTTFVPAGFPQINPAGAILGFAAQNPWPRMTCHCMSNLHPLPMCLAVAFAGHLAPVWSPCSPAVSSGCPGGCQWLHLAA